MIWAARYSSLTRYNTGVRFLILAHLEDRGALRVANYLRRRHGNPAVRVVSAEALAMAPRVVHALTMEPGAKKLQIQTEISLASGIVIEADAIGVVFNRLHSADALHFASATPADQEYANFEMSALWVSWLAGLGENGVAVINPPQRGALQPGYSQLEWLKLAAMSGFSIEEVQPNSERPGRLPDFTQRWLAAGKHLAALESPWLRPDDAQSGRQLRSEPKEVYFPTEIAGYEGRIHRLQALSGCAVFEFWFSKSADRDEAHMVRIEPFPALNEPSAVSVVAELLEEASR